MSAKWQRSRAWDDQNIPPAFAPVKWLLRAFSSIALAVVLLLSVVVYATMASVPIGMLAMGPTWILYGIAAICFLGVIAVLPVWVFLRLTASRGRGVRFGGSVMLLVVLLPIGGWLWLTQCWPVLHYDFTTGRGFLLFAEFCERYRATTLRRLPGMEMTELEFYAWWPLRIILLAFVLNMVTATLRRIEFSVKTIGVLTVHSGIVAITLGSIYYAGLKQEGDTLLISGTPAADGTPTPGPSQNVFYDNTTLSLFVGQQLGYEQRPIAGVPRYNDYNLSAFAGESALESARRELPWKHDVDPRGSAREMSIPVIASNQGIVDPDITFRMVGYASYAEPVQDWKRVDTASLSTVPPSFSPSPLRIIYMNQPPGPTGEVSDKPALSFVLLPRIPGERISELAGQIGIEYTAAMPASRWRDLTQPLPPDTMHAVVIEVPSASGEASGSSGERRVLAIDERALPARAAVGLFEIEVQQILPQPPFPIITAGYRGATSSVAVVRVTKPSDPSFKPFTRYCYHRFPEIDQDLLDAVNERGMPTRQAPDASIRIGYIDASQIQIYLDETPGVPGDPPGVRAIVRSEGGELRVIDPLGADGVVKDFVKGLSLTLGPRWDHAEAVERPAPVEPARQDRSMVGTHEKSLLAVEVASTSLKTAKGEPWKTVVWLPFTKYLGIGMGTERDVFIPDGRMVRLAFGRRQHPLPGFTIRLLDFQMLAYDHRGAPRDFQSLIRVEPTGPSTFQPFDHTTSLNAPLTAPFRWSDDRPWISNAFQRLVSGVDPNQFKFSQAGWDQAGWAKTQQQADAGLVPRPFAAFTILGVGNNPGIHIIALGGVMMGIGIPWAFYLKPYLARREKRKIQAQLAAGTYIKPVRLPPKRDAAGVSTSVVSEAQVRS